MMAGEMEFEQPAEEMFEGGVIVEHGGVGGEMEELVVQGMEIRGWGDHY